MSNGEQQDEKRGHERGEHKDHDRHTVVIHVNGNEVRLTKGEHKVSEIKAKGGVLQADTLAQVIHGALVDLDDVASVKINGKEVFHSHPRDSGSSHQ